MTKPSTFYVTTPIYYVNDIPHIGHAYTTIAADILARYHRLRGRKVFFLTGTDEHGQKVEKAAKDRGRSAQEHADLLVDNFRALWKKLNISNDAFIRTTDEDHKRCVQQLLQELFDSGEIEKRSYCGMYCTPCERFWTEKDLVEGDCPDCKRQVDRIEEENYFFLMSKYQQRLIDHIEGSEGYILPESRRNEVLGFLKAKPLGDLCISRPKSRLAWGIPLPFDDKYTTYVWFDALVNYYSATKYLAPQADGVADWWPSDHHLIGKDILTTHAVYWSTMLMALGLALPRNIFAHGWWTVNGAKMSKSVGNVVEPGRMAEMYGVDAFRYFLFREVTFGLDGDFSEEALVRRINTDLANDLGNLLNRFLTMAEKYHKGIIVQPAGYEQSDFGRECAEELPFIFDESQWYTLRFSAILERIWNIVRASNNCIARSEPWKLIKADPGRLKVVMFELWNALRLTALSLAPFIPVTAENMLRQLGLSASEAAPAGACTWDWDPAKEITAAKGEQLFPRIEPEKAPEPHTKKQEPSRPVEQTIENVIGIEDFAKVELRIATVTAAERVPKSDKLIRLTVDAGEERQIVAGIGKAYEPEYLVGKKIAVVFNLKPAKLMGVESRGMLLAATDSEGTLSILTPDRDVQAGSRIK